MSCEVCTHEVGDKVDEAKSSRTCSKGDMDASRVHLETVSHWTLNLKSSPILLFREDLTRETSRVVVVFYDESHLAGIIVAQDILVEGGKVKVSLSLKSLQVGHIRVRSHGIADGVVAGHFAVTVLNAADQEVLRQVVQALVKRLEVVDRLVLVHILEHDELGLGVNVHTEILAYATDSCVDFLVCLVDCDGKVIDDVSRNG